MSFDVNIEKFGEIALPAKINQWTYWITSHYHLLLEMNRSWNILKCTREIWLWLHTVTSNTQDFLGDEVVVCMNHAVNIFIFLVQLENVLAFFGLHRAWNFWFKRSLLRLARKIWIFHFLSCIHLTWAIIIQLKQRICAKKG